jgi:hypothetical protein
VWPRTSVIAAPGCESSGVNARPSVGWTPSTAKEFPVMKPPEYRSGRSPLVTLMVPV